MPTSQNGWPANDVTRTQSYKIPGSTRAVRLVKGDAGAILVHFAAWFHANIEPVDRGEFDDWGYAERNIRGSSTTLSNHASGCALDLNATLHPLAKSGTFPGTKAAKIRKQLKVYEGVIRWGGDYHGRKDEMHFEINVGPGNAAISRVASKLRGTPTGVTPDKPAQPGKLGDLVSLSAIAYAANGGYFHIGQAPALEDAQIVAGWLKRLGVISERDYRVWDQFRRVGNDKSAGLQYAGIIRKFQRRYGLSADGVVGPLTKSKLSALLTHDSYRVVS